MEISCPKASSVKQLATCGCGMGGMAALFVDRRLVALAHGAATEVFDSKTSVFESKILTGPTGFMLS